MNFSIRNYSSGPIIGESHNICHNMGSSVIVFRVCSHCFHFPFYKSSLTGAFFMHFDTHIWVLSLVLLFLTAFDAEVGTYGFRWYLVRMYCALSGARILYEW